jgi:hypothetical protein
VRPFPDRLFWSVHRIEPHYPKKPHTWKNPNQIAPKPKTPDKFFDRVVENSCVDWFIFRFAWQIDRVLRKNLFISRSALQMSRVFTALY